MITRRIPERSGDGVTVELFEDEGPVARAFVPRQCILTEQQWQTFHGAEATQPVTSSTVNGFPAGEVSPLTHHKGGLIRNCAASFDVEASNQNPRQTGRHINTAPQSSRSIFGLHIMSPCSAFARAWSGIILALDLVYTAFLIPVFLAFEIPDIGWTWACIVNLVAGSFYFAELLINFHVGFIAKYGAQKVVVLDGKAVARYYITQGTFVVDALTAAAWIAQIMLIILWEIGVNVYRHAVTVYQIIRLLRLIRFASLMRRLYATTIAAGNALLPASSFKPQYANFATLLYAGLAVLSFLACIMNYVARREHCSGTWMNYFGVFLHTYGSEDSIAAGVLNQEDCAAIPDPAKWLGGAYFMLVTMLTIGYGDVTPQSTTEIIIVMFCIIAGIIFFGILLGTIADALKDMNKESKRMVKCRTRMEEVDDWMTTRGLPSKLQMQIRQHYQEEWIADTVASEEVQVMEEVPDALRCEVSYALNCKMFKKLGFLHDFPVSEQISIAAMMTPLQLPAGADMCQAGDSADCLWVLHKGSVAARGAAGHKTEVISAPALLGETAVLQELDEQYHHRPCTLRTRQVCLLWVLPARDLLRLLQQKPALYHRAVQQAVPSTALYMDSTGTIPIWDESSSSIHALK